VAGTSRIDDRGGRRRERHGRTRTLFGRVGDDLGCSLDLDSLGFDRPRDMTSPTRPILADPACATAISNSCITGRRHYRRLQQMERCDGSPTLWTFISRTTSID